MQDATKGVQTSQMMLSQAQVSAQQQMMLATQQANLALSAQKATAAEVGIALATPIGAYGQLDAAMAALGPAGQQFVNWFMTSFYPVLKQLEFGAEGALLPGIEKALTTMGPYFQALGNAFDMFDSAFGVMLGKWATFLSSKQGIAEFNAAMKSGLGFMNDIGNAILLVMKGFGSLALVGGPATKAVGNAIVLIAQIFNQWASSPAMKILVQGFDDLVSVFTTLFQTLGGGGGLGVIIMLIGKFSIFADVLGLFVTFLPQLMPLFEALFGLLKLIMTDAIGPLMPAVRQLVAVLAGGLGKVLVALMPALVPLMNLLVKLALAVLIPLIPLITQLADVVAALLVPAVTVLSAPLQVIAQILVVVIRWVMGLVQAALDHLMPAFRQIESVMTPLAKVMQNEVGGAVKTLGAVFTTVWHDIQSVVSAVWNFLWGSVLSPLVKFFGGAISTDLRLFGNLWNTVWNGIKTVVQDVWSVISPIFNGLIKGVQAVTSAVSGVTSVLGSIGKGAAGAVSSVTGFVGKLFADGGYVDKPTPAIVGEAGPEVILPITNPARSLQLLRPLMQPGGALAMASAGGGGGTQQIINLQAITTADPTMIAREIAWELKTMTVAP